MAYNTQLFHRFVGMCLRWMDISVVILPRPYSSLKILFSHPASFSFCETLRLMIAHTGNSVQLVYKEKSGAGSCDVLGKMLGGLVFNI